MLGNLSAELTAKVAFGVTHQSLAINGTDTQTGTGAMNGTFNEGIYAQASNIGRYSSNDFSVVPQAQVKLGYDIFPWLRATIGYDFLYWTQVLRANGQIDRNVDISQSAVFGTGTAASSPSVDESFRLLAQGMALGLELRY